MSFTLVLSAESYPWSVAKEHTFLAPELEVLAREDVSVVLVPQRIGGERLSVPAKFEVDESLAKEIAGLRRRDLTVHAAQTTLVPEELARRGKELTNPTALKRLVDYAGRAHHAEGWIRRFLERRHLTQSRVVFLSYWWGPVTTGVGLAARKFPQLRVASRAHGFDLYEARHTPPYLPCRNRALSVLHGLFSASDAGTEWLRKTYASLPPRLETARLGITNPGAHSRASSDGVLRVVSCSLMVPVKRLHLLVEGLAQAGKTGARIEWTHHGVGELQASIEEQARRLLPHNVTATFPGYSTQQQLFTWYRDHPADVFVNVSQSEGTPVAIMEAIACGIPVLATSVGGNPEICTEKNGLLVSANPTAAELAAALLRFTAPNAWREGSLEVWKTKYDATANFSRWVETLRSL